MGSITTRRLRHGVVAASMTLAVHGLGIAAAEAGPVSVASVTMLLVHEHEWEDLVVSFEFSGASAAFGWIIPVPSMPVIEPLGLQTFTWLDRWSAYREPLHGFWRMVQSPVPRRALSEPAADNGCRAADIRLLTDRGTILRWLGANPHRLHPIDTTTIDHYLQQGWSLVVARVWPGRQDTTRNARSKGRVRPLRLSFRSREPVLPILLHPPGETPTALTLYVMADTLLVPRPACDLDWNTQVIHWRQRTFSENPQVALDVDRQTLDLLQDRSSRLWTSRHDVQIPGTMRCDLQFEVYDPMRYLDDPDSLVRLEAQTALVRSRSADAESALIEILRRPSSTASEVDGALVGLGYIGSTRSEDVLIGFARHPDASIRLDALDALQRLGATQRGAVFIENLQVPVPHDARPAERALRRIAFQHLLETKPSSERPRLKALQNTPEAWRQWYACAMAGSSLDCRFLEREEAGDAAPALSLILLAAMGDSAAIQTLAHALVLSQKQAPWEIEDMPEVFWTRRACRQDPMGVSAPWPAFVEISGLLPRRSDVRDPIFRAAIRTGRLDPARAMVLLANVAELTEEEVDWLWSEWRRARWEPVMLTIYDETAWTDRRVFRESIERGVRRVNHHGSLVPHVFARHGRVDMLERIADDLPTPGKENVEPDVILALATSGDPRFRSRIIAYAKRTWSAYARSAAYLAALKRDFGDIDRTHPLRLPVPLEDNDLRTALMAYLFDGPTARANLEGFLNDDSLPVHVRLYILEQARLREVTDLDVAIQACRTIAADMWDTHPNLAVCATTRLRELERRRTRMATDALRGSTD